MANLSYSKDSNDENIFNIENNLLNFTQPLSFSEDLQEFFAINSDENSTNLPLYKDPTEIDERAISSFKNRLRSALDSEVGHLKRKEMLKENFISSVSHVAQESHFDLLTSSLKNSSTTTTTCCASQNLLNQRVIFDFDAEKDLFEDCFNLNLPQIEISIEENENEINYYRNQKGRQPQQQSPDLFSEHSDDNLEDLVNDKCDDDDDLPNFNIVTSMEADNDSSVVDTRIDCSFCKIVNHKDEADEAVNDADDDDDDYNVNSDYCLKKRKTYLTECIQELIKSLIKSYKETGDVTLLIDDTSKWDNMEFTEQMLAIRKECGSRNVSINDGRTQFRFMMINYLLNEISKRLLAGVICTLRELYYQDPELCQDQLYLIKSLHDICCLLHCTPWELGIHSSSKGIVAGSLLLSFDDNTIIDCATYESIGFSLPKDVIEIEIIDSNAQFILLVEKDTVFDKLLQQRIFEKIPKEFILITGKGYPDINTRLLLRKILNQFQIPIYALMDADPFGIEIMLIYSYGSKELSYMSHYLACPEIQWIGVLPSEIELLTIPSMPLTNEDKKRIDDLFKRPYINDKISWELNKLLEFNRKAEIEAISSFSFNFLVNNYIPNKIV